ncbi:MAG: class II aldolase/adducin family protein [Candidatus Thorarchaeota archaeon]
MENRILWVSGSFDDNDGKSSGLSRKMYEYLLNRLEIKEIRYINGGNFKKLTNINFSDYNIIFWFANVSNDKPKIVENIKSINQKCLLITSKRNVEKKYDLREIVQKALKIKSNLIIEFSPKFKDTDSYSNYYLGRVLDPLGNIFLEKTDNFEQVMITVCNRIKELQNFTRVSSISVKDNNIIDIPNEKEFFNIVEKYGKKFHNLIHGIGKTNRFLGNASFRCEVGFPSFKQENDKFYIYVSKRNVDKRIIDNNSFVRVNLDDLKETMYHGNYKPSVDTPIQKRLYNYYKGIKYIVHGHIYIKGAKKTNLVIPCGSLEEFNEIKKLFPDPNQVNFCINLRGHGFVVLSDNLEYLRNIEKRFIMKNLFEVVKNNKNGI